MLWLFGLPDWLFGLPDWLVAGLLVGAAFSLVAAGAFLAGTRLFPGPETDRGRHATAEDRRRAEIRSYLLGLGEEFVEAHPVGGQTVAFYLPRRDVAITFDARAYFRIEGTGPHPVLVEHELPGGALGPRLPFETPEPDPAGVREGARGPVEEAGAPVATAFAELGLPPSAPLADVKAAYREQVKAVHPDQGGDPEAFQRLREAYTVAKETAD